MVQALVLPPNREIDFDCACVCVACVRASERNCGREMIPLLPRVGGQICGGPSGAGPDQKLELFEFRPMIRDRVELLSVPVWWSRCVVCFVRVSWRRALLDRGLGPPGVNVPARLGPPGVNVPARLGPL